MAVLIAFGFETNKGKNNAQTLAPLADDLRHRSRRCENRETLLQATRLVYIPFSQSDRGPAGRCMPVEFDAVALSPLSSRDERRNVVAVTVAQQLEIDVPSVGAARMYAHVRRCKRRAKRLRRIECFESFFPGVTLRVAHEVHR